MRNEIFFPQHRGFFSLRRFFPISFFFFFSKWIVSMFIGVVNHGANLPSSRIRIALREEKCEIEGKFPPPISKPLVSFLKVGSRSNRVESGRFSRRSSTEERRRTAEKRRSFIFKSETAQRRLESFPDLKKERSETRGRENPFNTQPAYPGQLLKGNNLDACSRPILADQSTCDASLFHRSFGRDIWAVNKNVAKVEQTIEFSSSSKNTLTRLEKNYSRLYRGLYFWVI